MTENKAVFETLPMPRALAALAVPTIISQLITMIYNLADTFFIGCTNDPYKVAAAALSFALFFLTNALANLFGVGGGSLISRLLGAGRPEAAKKVSAFSFYGALAAGVLYSLIFLLFREPVLRLLGASDQTLGYASAYLFWTLGVGAAPTVVSVTMGHLLRSEGRARRASLGLGMGGVLNILLDPLFMFVILPPGNEVTGAAMATMISNVVVLAYFVLTFRTSRGDSVLSLSPAQVSLSREYTLPVFSVGLPAAFATLLASTSSMILNRLASNAGDIPIAAIGIAKKIDMLPLNVGAGLCQGMTPLVAYNYSAGNYKRMKEASRCARIAGIGFALVCVACYLAFPDRIVGLFIDEPETVAMGAAFLRVLCAAVPFMIFNFLISYTFQACGKGRESLFLSLCRQGLAYIPLLFLMDRLFGLYGLVWGQLIADGITLGLSTLMYRRLIRSLRVEEALDSYRGDG